MMRVEAGWPAPAKLNLFLHITGRRPDGYHTLQSLFQFLDYGDRLEFRVTEAPGVRLLAPQHGVPPGQDLALRAARLLQQRSGVRRGVEIRLDKRLPLGGGLGGGSSDAATTLVVLNRLWEAGLDEATLAALGLELGADVPVFVRGRAAWAEGVGERLTPVEVPEPWYLVIVPPVSVSTAAVFQHPELTRDSRPITISDFLAGRSRNDCEAIVRQLHPEIAAALDWLNGRTQARLTGTGACVFGAFGGREDALSAQQALPAGWGGFIARGCNRSPLHAALSAG
ncbi:MAG TPA: 4-(cytidine 5'-diphospho)-2-C-methyl-D-erythritol kinase [Thiohalobacter sp.]|nr:4-(cytidine 5'-diphospho)-2-C-methyl-D-erythritol kinase [Thiohalobacter sp.]